MGDYSINEIYQGGYSSFDSNYNTIGTNIKVGSLGMATDPRTANVLKDVSGKLATGAKTIEISQVSPEVFESIPKGYLKEVNELAQLTGAEVTLHAPVVEPSGITQQGYSEVNREGVERQMKLAIERAHELNPRGSSPVTFHSSAGLPAPEVIPREKGVEIQKELIINQESGQIQSVKKETKYYPQHPDKLKQGIPFSVKEQIKSLNESEWDQSLSQLLMYKESADRIIDETGPIANKIMEKLQTQNIKPENLTTTEQNVYGRIINAAEHLKHTRLTLQGLFNRAYTYADEEKRKQLTKLSEEFSSNLKNIKPGDIQGQSLALQKLINDLQIENPETREFMFAPELYKSLNDFSREKTTTTFANVAFDSYKKYKDEAPIISIENPPAGTAFSTGEELKQVIEDSRKKFIEQAVKEGLKEKEAKKAAEKLIGATWDVGHINMLRKQGFEAKNIIEESEKIAPYVKHVHLSDNFGLEHTELPMGMGNVPMKEIMEKLGKEGFEAKKIIEAGNWWQHFSPQGGPQNSPFLPTLKAMGSPIYSVEMGPYWSQSLGLQQGYFSGYGEMLPSINYQTWGAGFSQLPQELGGQIANSGGSRFSGRGME